jgi:hypothetical protein
MLTPALRRFGFTPSDIQSSVEDLAAAVSTCERVLPAPTPRSMANARRT